MGWAARHRSGDRQGLAAATAVRSPMHEFLYLIAVVALLIGMIYGVLILTFCGVVLLAATATLAVRR